MCVFLLQSRGALQQDHGARQAKKANHRINPCFESRFEVLAGISKRFGVRGRSLWAGAAALWRGFCHDAGVDTLQSDGAASTAGPRGGGQEASEAFTRPSHEASHLK